MASDCQESPTTVSVTGIASYACPTHVDKNNWLSMVDDHLSESFVINQNGDSITVTRIDAQEEWCMGLAFMCCRGELYMFRC